MDSKLMVYCVYYIYVHIIIVDTKIFAFCAGFLVKGMIYDILENSLPHLCIVSWIFQLLPGFPGCHIRPSHYVYLYMQHHTFTFYCGAWTLKAGFTQGITSLDFLRYQITSAVLLRSTYACESMSEFYRRIYHLFFHSYIFSIVLRNTNIKLFIYFLRKEEIGIPLN